MSLEDRNKACGICQSTEYHWGTPASDGGAYFHPHNSVPKLGIASTFTGNYGLEVRVCAGCGNMQWFMRYYPESEDEKKKNG